MTKVTRHDRHRRIPALLAALAAGALAAGALAAGAFPVQAEPTRAPAASDKKEIVFHSNRVAGKGVSNPEGDAEIFVVKPDGTGLRQLTRNDSDDVGPAWSPDGERIAFTSYRGADFEAGNFGGDIYVMRADGKKQTRLTDHPDIDADPAWSPNGRQIAFTSYRNGDADVYKMGADGSRQTNLTRRSSGDSDPDWSPTGESIAFVSRRDAVAGAKDPNAEIYKMKADGSRQTRLTKNPDPEESPAFSPDGKRIAFTRLIQGGRGDNTEVYAMDAGGARPTNLTRNAAFDRAPSWSPDGKWIAFASNRGSDLVYSDTKIHKMKANGAEQTKVTQSVRPPEDDDAPDWVPRR